MKIKLCNNSCSSDKINITLSRSIYRYYFSKKYYQYKVFIYGNVSALIIKYFTKAIGGKIQLVTEYFLKNNYTNEWELLKTLIFYSLPNDFNICLEMLNIKCDTEEFYSNIEKILLMKDENNSLELKELNEINNIYKSRIEFYKSSINSLKKLQNKD